MCEKSAFSDTNMGRQVIWRLIYVYVSVSRTTKKFLDRSRNTLRLLIEHRLEDTRYISSDQPVSRSAITVHTTDFVLSSPQWRAYAGCEEYFEEHRAVNLSRLLYKIHEFSKRERPLLIPAGLFLLDCQKSVCPS